MQRKDLLSLLLAIKVEEVTTVPLHKLHPKEVVLGIASENMKKVVCFRYLVSKKARTIEIQIAKLRNKLSEETDTRKQKRIGSKIQRLEVIYIMQSNMFNMADTIFSTMFTYEFPGVSFGVIREGFQVVSMEQSNNLAQDISWYVCRRAANG